MKFLIGLLILLFVLTTIGFSGTAFAVGCENTFSENYPREESYDYQREESEFNIQNSGYYNQGSRSERFDQWNEFQSERSDNEFNYNENF